jgi:hypothetical protein
LGCRERQPAVHRHQVQRLVPWSRGDRHEVEWGDMIDAGGPRLPLGAVLVDFEARTNLSGVCAMLRLDL